MSTQTAVCPDEVICAKCDCVWSPEVTDSHHCPNCGMDSQNSHRLFAGVYPCGIVYADRFVEEHGDYKRLAFLSYRTLELQWDAKSVPVDLRLQIEADAATIQAQRGQQYQISTCGQTVMLGT